MKLIPEINTEEIEIHAKQSKFGFNVTVMYKESDWMAQYNPQIHHNVTEVHWLYNIKFKENNKGFVGSVAIESAIHFDGGTRELNRIEYITIEVATELHPHH